MQIKEDLELALMSQAQLVPYLAKLNHLYNKQSDEASASLQAAERFKMGLPTYGCDPSALVSNPLLGALQEARSYCDHTDGRGAELDCRDVITFTGGSDSTMHICPACNKGVNRTRVAETKVGT